MDRRRAASNGFCIWSWITNCLSAPSAHIWDVSREPNLKKYLKNKTERQCWMWHQPSNFYVQYISLFLQCPFLDSLSLFCLASLLKNDLNAGFLQNVLQVSDWRNLSEGHCITPHSPGQTGVKRRITQSFSGFSSFPSHSFFFLACWLSVCWFRRWGINSSFLSAIIMTFARTVFQGRITSWLRPNTSLRGIFLGGKLALRESVFLHDTLTVWTSAHCCSAELSCWTEKKRPSP